MVCGFMTFDSLKRRWLRAHRFTFTRKKLSRPIIRENVARWATKERTLILNPEEGIGLFPNRVIGSRRGKDKPDILFDWQMRELSAVEAGSFAAIVCFGLMEHLEDPQRFVNDLQRILTPGGRLIMTCASVFCIHEGPGDYFHFMPAGIRVLFRDWTRLEELAGTCGPFMTLAILMQRMHFQCDIFPPLRPLMEVAFRALPFFDRFVTAQYENLVRTEEHKVPSMMSTNMWLVAVK